MSLNIMETMNYRMDNPEIEVEVDTKIAENFVGREREAEKIEQFELWGSTSKEANKIKAMINSYKNMLSENTINKKI